VNKSDFDLPSEFASYNRFIEKDFEQFFPIFKRYENEGYTFFQSIVYSSDDLASSTSIPQKDRDVYAQIAMIGYFLLSEYSKAMIYPMPKDDFTAMFFKLKAAKMVGDKKIIHAIIANLLAVITDMKKTNLKESEVCNIILALEIGSINSDMIEIQNLSKKFKEKLFENVLIESYPLVTIQVVSDLAYREFRTGDEAFSEWLEIYKELAEAFHMETKRLDCYTMLGGLYRFKGYLDEAMDYFSKAMYMAERVGNKEFIADLISNMADLEHTKGNLEKAFFLCNEALKDPEISESKPSIYINLAEILIKQEKYEEVHEYLQKAEKLSSQLAPIINILSGYTLVKLSGKKNLHNGIKLLQKGGVLAKKIKNRRWIATYYYFMGRVYLETYDLSSAIDSFEKCNSIAITAEFQYVVLSQLYLAETYLQRYKISQLETDLTKSKHYLANIITICQEQDLPILADVFYLQGQLLSVLEEYTDAHLMFYNAKQLADENNYQWLSSKCDANIMLLQSRKFEKPTMIIHDMTRVINDLTKYSFTKRTERLPELSMLIVFTNEGTNIFSYYFDEETAVDEVLTSGLVAAIRTMSSEVFGSGLRGIDFEGKRLLVESYGKFCGILGCSNDSFNARTKLYDFLKRFEVKFGKTVDELKYSGKFPEVKTAANHLVKIVFGLRGELEKIV